MKNNLNLKLIPKNESEKEQFLEETIKDYAKGLAKANDLNIEEAMEMSKRQIEQALYHQKETTQTKIVTIFDETINQAVGGIWFVINTEKMTAYSYQIFVDEKHRGKGYGKAALSELHNFCKTQNIKRTSLSVFGWNTLAFDLYKKMGYEIVQIVMKKDLDE